MLSLRKKKVINEIENIATRILPTVPIKESIKLWIILMFRTSDTF